MGRSKVFQITGFQNSGKTTLVEEMLRAGTKLGLSIGTLKHHGHGGEPEKILLKKDTDRHWAAGAEIVGVAGEKNMIIEASHHSMPLEKMIDIYEAFNMDLILVEGFKYAPYEKVVLIRNQADVFLMQELDNIKAVISWIPMQENGTYKVFQIEETNQFMEWFFNEQITELG